MRAESRARLLDAVKAAEGIASRTAHVTLAAYLADEDLRLVVERLFITIGEALNGVAKSDEDTAARIADLPRLVAFRNMLVHGYAKIESSLVYALARRELLELRATLASLLVEGDPK